MIGIRFVCLLLLLSVAAASYSADNEGPWPADVKGWQPPAAGEHPRLFFRKSDLPELKKLWWRESLDANALTTRVGEFQIILENGKQIKGRWFWRI